MCLGMLCASSKSAKEVCLRRASWNGLCFGQAKRLDFGASSFKLQGAHGVILTKLYITSGQIGFGGFDGGIEDVRRVLSLLLPLCGVQLRMLIVSQAMLTTDWVWCPWFYKGILSAFFGLWGMLWECFFFFLGGMFYRYTKVNSDHLFWIWCRFCGKRSQILFAKVRRWNTWQCSCWAWIEL